MNVSCGLNFKLYFYFHIFLYLLSFKFVFLLILLLLIYFEFSPVFFSCFSHVCLFHFHVLSIKLTPLYSNVLSTPLVSLFPLLLILPWVLTIYSFLPNPISPIPLLPLTLSYLSITLSLSLSFYLPILPCMYLRYYSLLSPYSCRPYFYPSSYSILFFHHSRSLPLSLSFYLPILPCVSRRLCFPSRH